MDHFVKPSTFLSWNHSFQPPRKTSKMEGAAEDFPEASLTIPPGTSVYEALQAAKELFEGSLSSPAEICTFASAHARNLTRQPCKESSEYLQMLNLDGLVFWRSNGAKVADAVLAKLQPLIIAIEDFGRIYESERGEKMEVRFAGLEHLTEDEKMLVWKMKACKAFWGSIRVVLCAAQGKNGRFFEGLVECFGRIGDILPRFRDYEQLCSEQKHQRLTQALSNAYLDVIVLCIDFRNMLRHQTKSLSIPRVLKPVGALKPMGFECQFSDAVQRFRKHRRTVEREAERCLMHDEAEAKLLEEKKRGTQEMSNKAQLRKQMVSYLSSTDHSYRYRKLKETRCAGTGGWLKNSPEYKGWLNSDSSSVLYLQGKPGIGKSVLCSTVIDDLLAPPDSCFPPLAYHYCDYADKTTLDPAIMCGSIAQQLLSRLDELPDSLVSLIDRIYQGGYRIPQPYEVAEVFYLAIKQFFSCTIVLDGLDEVAEDDRREFLAGLSDFENKCTGSIVKLLVSTREDYSILSRFKLFRPFGICITPEDTSLDLKNFVTESVRDLLRRGDLVLQNEKLEADIVKALTEGAQGIFLWAKFQLQELCEAESDFAIKEVLRTLPRDLTKTYERLLHRLWTSHNGTEKHETYRKIFQWLTCARRPIRLDEMKEIIAFTIEDHCWDPKKIPAEFRRLVRHCGNLITIDEESKTLRFTHYTVQQHLLRTDDPGDRSFQYTQTQAENEVGEFCVAYLSFEDFAARTDVSSDDSPTALSHMEKAFATRNMVRNNTITYTAAKLWEYFGSRSASPPTSGTDSTYSSAAKQPTEFCLQSHRLLGYVADHWLWHTSRFDADKENKERNQLFESLLIDKRLQFSIKPWADLATRTDGGVDQVTSAAVLSWALEINHPPLLRVLQDRAPAFDTTFSLIEAAEWLFPEHDDETITEIMLQKLLPDVSCNPVGYRGQMQRLYGNLLGACRKGHSDLIRAALCNLKDSRFQHPAMKVAISHLLLEAAALGHEQIVEWLFTYSGFSRTLTCPFDGHAYNAIERAALAGHLNIVKILFVNGFRPKNLMVATDDEPLSPDVKAPYIVVLHEAAGSGKTNVIEALLFLVNESLQKENTKDLREWEAEKSVAIISAASKGDILMLYALLGEERSEAPTCILLSDAHFTMIRQAFISTVCNGHKELVAQAVHAIHVPSKENLRKRLTNLLPEALVQAELAGNPEMVRIVKDGYDCIHDTGISQDAADSMLSEAIITRKDEDVEYILSKNFAASPDGTYPLRTRTHIDHLRNAVIHGTLRAATLLLQHGANPDGLSPDSPPLYAAILSARDAVVSLLLTYHASPNTPLTHLSTPTTPLALAVTLNSLPILSLLLSSGAIDTPLPNTSTTALSLATEAQNLPMIHALQSAPSRPGTPSLSSTTFPTSLTPRPNIANTSKPLRAPSISSDRKALIRAVILQQHAAISTLLSRTSDVNFMFELSPSIKALLPPSFPFLSMSGRSSQHSDSASIDWASLDLTSPNLTSLRPASAASLRSADKQGLRLLHIAAYNGSLKIVEALLEKGARIDAQDVMEARLGDTKGRTALDYAVLGDKREVANLLLRRGARASEEVVDYLKAGDGSEYDTSEVSVESVDELEEIEVAEQRAKRRVSVSLHSFDDDVFGGGGKEGEGKYSAPLRVATWDF